MTQTAAASGRSLRRPSRIRALATTVTVVLTMVLAAAVGCDDQKGPQRETVEDVKKQSNINGQPKLRIGVSETSPLMGYLDDGVRRGFDIDIARYIAGSLGYEGDDKIEWVRVTTEGRTTAIKQGTVDMVVASFSMRDDPDVAFAGPYLVTTQEVMIRTELKGKITTINDLRDPKYHVCASGGSTTQKKLEESQIRVEPEESVRDCVAGLLSGRYDATSSDLTILAGFHSLYQEKTTIVKMPFGRDESLGIGVAADDEALRKLVSYFLNKSYLDDRAGKSTAWQAAYNNSLGYWLGPARQPRPRNVPDLIDHDDKAAR